MRPASRFGGLVLGALMLAACQGSVPTPTPTPTPVASNQTSSSPAVPSMPLAVYDGPTLDGNGHVVYLVGVGSYGEPPCQPDCSFAAKETARVLHAEVAARRSYPPFKTVALAVADLPSVSTSLKRVYFLDGDSRVRAMTADGKVSDAATLPGSALIHAVFAVSPDDARIAVSLFDYQKQPVLETLYVSALSGIDRSDIFTSTSGYYWPVGWHEGKLILATGSLSSVGPNQYNATGFALIDPVKGAQPVVLGTGDCLPTGAITPAGFACVTKPGSTCVGASVGSTAAGPVYSSCLRRVDWSGKETTFLITSEYGINDMIVRHAALSPDGHVLITDTLFWVTEPGAGGYPGGQNGFTSSVPFNRFPDQPGIGWLDPHHVSFLFINAAGGSTYQRIYALDGSYSAFKNVYFVDAGGSSFVPGGTVIGQLMGTLPGGL